MRADPEHRRPAQLLRRAELLPVAARAWGLLLIFSRRAPGLVVAGAVAFAAGDRIPAMLLERAHAGLGGSGDLVADFGLSGAAWLYALMVLRFMLPAVVGAGLFLAMQRMFMAGGGGFASLWLVGSWARVAAALIVLKLVGSVVAWLAAALPILLVLLLGQVSALLTLVLIAPLLGVVGVCLVRLSLSPACMALGLGKALTESWEITRGRVLRLLGVWMVASAPVAVLASAWAWWGGESYLLGALPLGLVELMVAGAVSSLLYQAYRLPADLRPDRRPSLHRSRRVEPALAK